MSKPFTQRPALSGSYFYWEADSHLTVAPVLGNTLAVPGPADWGPVNTVEELESFDDYRNLFGDTLSPLAIAVYGAFRGEGVGGRGGAGTVLAYRMATAAAAKATITLNNSAGTPAPALRLTAKYPGARANALSATVQPGPQTGTTQILILDGPTVVETYTFHSTDLASGVGEINLFSNWFDAAVLVDGTALGTVSGAAATGGANGDTLTSAEWTAAMAAFDSQRWSLFAGYDITDSATRAAVEAWILNRNNLGSRCMAVFGGPAGELLADALTRSLALNDWNTVCLGVGTMHDNTLGLDLSTSQLAPRVAGAIAARGEVKDLIYARFADLTMVTPPPSLADQANALRVGLTVFCKDTNVTAPVFIKEGVTSYSDDTSSPLDEQGNKTRPVWFYKRIKNVRIQQGIELEVQDWATSGDVLGEFQVDEKTRGIVLGYIKTRYAIREAAEIVQPGWTVVLDPSVPVSDDDDFVQYQHGFHPTRSLRQILNVARVG